MIYKINKNKVIKIFDEIFVKNNKYRCKIIIDNKILSLRDKYTVKDNFSKYLKVKLILLNSFGFNLKKMFYKCKNLSKFSVLSQENSEVEIKEEQTEFFKRINNDNKTNKRLKNKTYFFRKKLIFIYQYSNEIKDEHLEKMKKLIICSHNNSSQIPFYYQWKPEIINNNESNSINKYSITLSIIKQTKTKSGPNEKEKKSYEKKKIFVKNVSHMFDGYESLITISGISDWNTENLIDIRCIFKNCYFLESIPDISNWKTGNCIYMNEIFFACISLISLPDISKWDTKKVKYITFMFFHCSCLISLPDIYKECEIYECFIF